MIKYIHVAGTNGKGSTCAYIAQGLLQSGYKVGRFISPHVLDVTERITVNDVPIDSGRLPVDFRFQQLWAIALEYFFEQQVDYAVIETGIGGLLDCTNRLDLPDYQKQLSVITKIGYDHTELLGNTIEEIAAHKAGIIKGGVPVVTDPTQLPGAMEVISDTARLKASPLIVPTQMPDDPFECNRIVAIEALKILDISVGDIALDVPLPGRFQTVSQDPLVIIDGAHNPCAMRWLAYKINQYPQDKTIVFGMTKSKDYNTCMKLLPTHKKLILIDDVSCENEVRLAVERARGYGNMIVVCGSLYLAGNALKLFEI